MNPTKYHRSSTGRIRRRGVLGMLARPVFHWMAGFVMLGVNLPMLFAGLLAVFNSGSDHELQLSFAGDRVEVTLHHRDGGLGQRHVHSFSETLLIGQSISRNEPDHHIGFNRESVISEEDELRVHELAETIDFQPPTTDLPSFWPIAVATTCSVRIPTDQDSSPPPLLLQRGVMMRI